MLIFYQLLIVNRIIVELEYLTKASNTLTKIITSPTSIRSLNQNYYFFPKQTKFFCVQMPNFVKGQFLL